MTNTIALTTNFALKAAVAGVMMSAIALISLPHYAGAATYAYVAQNGEVKTVVANDWMTAIASALDIHGNSGVAELITPADVAEVVGAIVESVR